MAASEITVMTKNSKPRRIIIFHKRQNKYHATSCIYNGIIYQSKKEAAYAQELDLRIKAKDIKSWKRQVKIDIRINGEHWRNYYVDFEVTHNDNSIEWVEVKGFETEVWKMKRDALELTILKERPEISYTVVK